MVENVVGRMKAGIRRSGVTAVATAALAAGMLAGLLGGCASTDTGASEVWDPLEGPNRFIFSINRTVDMIAVRPLAVLYRDWMPERGQKGVRNVIDNLSEPVTMVNEVVQGAPGKAANSLGRFIVNSTIGIAGVFDVASAIGMPKTKEDMGKTIGYYAGVEPENGGFYIVLPVIGPSNARDGVGLAIDASMDPFSIVTFSISSTVGWVASAARYGTTAIDFRSRTLFALDDLEKNSVDYYAAMKSAYTQQRAELIRQKREKTDGKAEIDRRDNVALVR